MSEEISAERSSRSTTAGLLAIRGIGPAVARRLADVRLGSLEQLAEASPDAVVASSVGWPFRPDRDRARDWIDQARQLLATPSTGAASRLRAPRAARAAPSPPRVRHTFTLEVQTNDDSIGSAVATRIVDVESQAFDTWSGWDPERIGRFVVAHSGLTLQDAVEPVGGAAGGEEPQVAMPPAQGGDHAVPQAVLAFGIVDSPVVVRGGTLVRAVLRLGADDTMAVPEGVAVEWDLAVGPATGRATDRLSRHRVDLLSSEPLVIDTFVAVPGRYAHARLVAVVRMLAPGSQPRLARRLTDSRLDVTPTSSGRTSTAQAARSSSGGKSTVISTGPVVP